MSFGSSSFTKSTLSVLAPRSGKACGVHTVHIFSLSLLDSYRCICMRPLFWGTEGSEANGIFVPSHPREQSKCQVAITRSQSRETAPSTCTVLKCKKGNAAAGNTVRTQSMLATMLCSGLNLSLSPCLAR